MNQQPPEQSSYPQQQPYYPPQQQPQTFNPFQQSQQPFYPPPQQEQISYPQQPYSQQFAPPMQAMVGAPVSANVTNVNVSVGQKGPGFLIRAIYFVFIGWWLGFFWLNLGFALCALIITLPLGLLMLNRLPQVITLRQSSEGNTTSVNISTVNVHPGMGAPGIAVQNINVTVGGSGQHSFFVRAIYYIFIGCWIGYIWACIGYFCCLTILLLPVGIMMLNRLPAVLTLRK